jgi:uncharacterized protein involved in exopolysaccharide biosynthesis/Mrp family chromosome partitioning ATPase
MIAPAGSDINRRQRGASVLGSPADCSEPLSFQVRDHGSPGDSAMNERVTYFAAPEVQPSQGRQFGDDVLHPAEILSFAKRYSVTIGTCSVAGLALAGLYLGSVEPSYTASTQILIDPKTPPLLETQSRELKVSLDTAELESQMAVLRSVTIATMVIDELNLLEDPEFHENEPSALVVLTDTILDALRDFEHTGAEEADAWRADIVETIGPEVAPWDERTQVALEHYRKKLGVSRMGMSYVLDIRFSSKDPEKAARIANAIADAYTREQLQSKIAAAQQGHAWLEQRLNELRRQLNVATNAVQAFRATHDYRIPAVKEPHSVDATLEGPTLEELEATAATYRTMYESVLQAFTSSMQHQSYPYSVMRVIGSASRPLYKSQPRTKLVLVFGALAGMLFGVGLAFVRNVSDRSLRSSVHVEKELGLECLAEIPRLGGGFSATRRLKQVLRSPLSAFSQQLRKAKHAIAFGAGGGKEAPRCLGVTSALPGEGKTTIASNLAILASLSGSRTLVIDADFKGAAITKAFAGAGLSRFDGDLDSGDPRRSIVEVPVLFDLLPASHARLGGSDSGSGPNRTAETFKLLLDSYDQIIVDFPTGTVAEDTLGHARQLDGLVIVVEQNRTSSDVVLELVRSWRLARVGITGVVLTKV